MARLNVCCFAAYFKTNVHSNKAALEETVSKFINFEGTKLTFLGGSSLMVARKLPRGQTFHGWSSR